MLDSLPACASTGVGSLPFRSANDAVAHVMSSYDLPFCPQLPAVEGDMVTQWLGANPYRCGWSTERDRERPRAWDAFRSALAERPPAHGVAKLQVTGPLTLAVALEGRESAGGRVGALGFARELAAWLAAAAAEQTRALGELGLRTLVVVDEPCLEALALDPARAATVWEPLRAAAPAWGLHVCCRVPWDVVEHAEPDLISFDLAGTRSADRRGITALERLLRRGGRVAWGVMRVDSDDQTAAGARWLWEAVTALRVRGLDRDGVLAQSLVTPSCGTALASPARERSLVRGLDAVAGTGRALAGARDSVPA
jgi:hypothetical protein